MTVLFYATVLSHTVGFDILSPLCVMWTEGAAVHVEETEEEYADGCFRTEFLKIRTRGFSKTRSENQTQVWGGCPSPCIFSHRGAF